jgi:hypothetical protein
MHLHKPKNRPVQIAEFYASEVKSAGFVPTFVSTFDQMAGGHFVTKAIGDAFAAGHNLMSGVVAMEFGQLWNGGDAPSQQVFMEFYDAKFGRTGFIDQLDQATHVLRHLEFIGGGLRLMGTTDGVDSLFNVGGIVDTQQNGMLYAMEYQNNTYFQANASILPEGSSVFASTFAGKLQTMFDGLAPYGNVSISEDQQAFDNLSYSFNGDSALVAAAPAGTPLNAQAYITLE